MEDREKEGFTHMEYRRAKIAHVITFDKNIEFYYKGKLITKEDADRIVERYLRKKMLLD